MSSKGSITQRCKVNKAIPVSGRGGPEGCETSRLPHCLDNRFRDGDQVSHLLEAVRQDDVNQLSPMTSGIEPGTFRLVA
jgi:hypothetical protein